MKLFRFIVLFVITVLYCTPTIIKAQTANDIEVKGNSFSFSVSSDNNYKDEKTGSLILRNYSESTDESQPGTYKIPHRDIIIAIPPLSRPQIKVTPVTITETESAIPMLNPQVIKSDSDIVYKAPEYNLSASDNYAGDIYEIRGYFWYRDFYCVHLRLNNYKFDERASRIIEFKNIKIELNFNQGITLLKNSPVVLKSRFDEEFKNVLYNWNIAEQFRSTRKTFDADSSGNWIDYNSVYLKLAVADDGLYRISKNELEKAGLSSAVADPRTFRLFESGHEVPIYAAGEEDGVFNDNDYIEFYGTKHYSKISSRKNNPNGTPYNNYMDQYSDTTYYFLGWGGIRGKRIPVQNNITEKPTDTLKYYTDFAHVEMNTMYQPLSTDVVKNQDPEWLETNGWFWGWWGVGTMNFSFTVNDLVPNKNAAIYFKAVSGGSSLVQNAHNIAMHFKSAVIDTQVVNLNERVCLGGVFNSGMLSNGQNSFSVINYPNGSSPNYFAYDWYEVEYPRQLKAINDSLIFGIRDSVSKALRIIKIDNVSSSDIILYKVKPFVKRITDFSYSGKSVSFTDTVGAGSVYVITVPDKVLHPKYMVRKQFVYLRSPSRKADYIAITHPTLKESAINYVNFIAENYKLSTELIMINDIYDEFSFGYPEPEAVRLFLKSSLSNWNAPRPSYLVLIGSACYDYKNNISRNGGIEINKNLVPSYGEPVSDAWFAMLDPGSPLLQQMYVGRLAVNSPAELNYYLQKHKKYISRKYDAFNKTSLFFSGGDGNNASQLSDLKSVNDYIINNYVVTAPIAGAYSHFYKTANPLSDFGPYDISYVNKKILKGGLFISYLGHSGTRTWDNSISEAEQLNNSSDNSFLVTDFGCSTNKFAEPDVASFGALFTNKGQAIAYIGNSSLGFTSTSYTVPRYFYESLLHDSVYTLGRAHLASKIKMFNKQGTSGVYKIFALTNTLIGDPVINLAIPPKPNLVISPEDVMLAETFPNDQADSVSLLLNINNLGAASAGTFSVTVNDSYNNNKVYSKSFNRILPELTDSVVLKIPVRGRAGLHQLSVVLDSGNTIDEIYENDNTLNYSFNVSTVSVRPYIFDRVSGTIQNMFKLLNPSDKFPGKDNQITIQADTTDMFTSGLYFSAKMDSFSTSIDLSKLSNNKRYWVRYKIDSGSSLWDQPISLIKTPDNAKVILNDLTGFSRVSLSDVNYSNGGLRISADTVAINVKSGGGNVSKYGSINRNGINILPNTFTWGMGIAVFDQATLKVDTVKTYWYGDDAKEANNLARLINSIAPGKIVVMNAIDDASSNLTQDLKAAIKTLGSTKVDQIKYRGPWVLIGKKGAAPGSVTEIVKDASYPEVLIADTVFVTNKLKGKVLTNLLGPAKEWNKLNVVQSAEADSLVKFRVLGIRNDSGTDTLNYLIMKKNSADLTSIDAGKYPFIRLQSELKAGPDGSSPLLNSMAVEFLGTPELGTNYQAVSVSGDTVAQGSDIDLKFSVYNAGESNADSIRVAVELLKSDNTKKILGSFIISRLDTMQSKTLSYKYRTNNSDGSGKMGFGISIDPEGRIQELYKDNNYYSVSFFVKPDTTSTSVSSATVSVTFDGKEITDGDFISSRPEMVISLKYPVWFPLADTSAVQFNLDGRVLLHSGLGITNDTMNRRILYKCSPELANGEHFLRIVGKNVSGRLDNSSAFEKTFQVSDELKLIDVYNYPNPFRENTYFTFRLTQIPDELKVNIYTVAGRLIQQIEQNYAQLHYDFNQIYWDGRDKDGDAVANGVYLYKIILKKGEKREETVQKLAKIR
ncbi:MAG: C25 family cysteine peptidase [Ignavibacteriales bacterium]